jgi:hypothetical protein
MIWNIIKTYLITIKKARKSMREFTVYYWINDLKIIGKRENHVPYLYDKEKGWLVDNKHILMDRLMGYDVTEPEGYPYGIGNTDMLSRIEGISEEEAIKLINSMT